MKTKTITEKLKDYLVPVRDERKQFREALEKNRTASEQLCRAAKATRCQPLAPAGVKL